MAALGRARREGAYRKAVADSGSPAGYHRRVSAPVVVIIAAGEGTRMRSATPKLLHPLCGRPLINWTVAAAREAGASKVVVVDGPARALDRALDGQVEVAVQERAARGQPTRSKPRASTSKSTGTVVVVNGDNPLFTPDTIQRLVEAHDRSGAAATIATAILECPGRFGRVVRAPDGTVERVVETKAAGDASALELEIQEVNAGLYAFDGELLQQPSPRSAPTTPRASSTCPTSFRRSGATSGPWTPTRSKTRSRRSASTIGLN